MGKVEKLHFFFYRFVIMMEYAREEDPAIVKEMRGCCGNGNCWKKLESEGREWGGEEQGEREDGRRNSRGGESEGTMVRKGKEEGKEQKRALGRSWEGGGEEEGSAIRIKRTNRRCTCIHANSGRTERQENTTKAEPLRRMILTPEKN